MGQSDSLSLEISKLMMFRFWTNIWKRAHRQKQHQECGSNGVAMLHLLIKSEKAENMQKHPNIILYLKIIKIYIYIV